MQTEREDANIINEIDRANSTLSIKCTEACFNLNNEINAGVNQSTNLKKTKHVK